MTMSEQPRDAMDWEGRTIVDRSGEKIGTIDEIYLVEETGQPEWALVRLGRLGKSRATLVPLLSADPVKQGVRAAYEKSVVTDAPRIDANGEPSEQQVNAIYRHYGIEYGQESPAGAAGDGANGHGAGRQPARAAAVATTPAPSNGASEAAAEVVDGSADLREEPLKDIVKHVTDEATTLLRQEIKLAKAEMTEKAKEAGVGAGMFGGAGYTLHLASLGLMLCLIFALATAMPAWLAALVVTVVFVAVAGALALAGKKRIKKAGPPIPEATIESVKQTIETVKEEAKWGLGQTR
jgi:uncharacterized membrane protein YqjE